MSAAKARFAGTKMAVAVIGQSADEVCARCAKRVYLIEKIKCLDKLWHKTCFKCTTCNSQLTMNTYMGFNKKPYCKVHYPIQKHTLVPDTPEMKRLTATTKMQSNIQYHQHNDRCSISISRSNSGRISPYKIFPGICLPHSQRCFCKSNLEDLLGGDLGRKLSNYDTLDEELVLPMVAPSDTLDVLRIKTDPSNYRPLRQKTKANDSYEDRTTSSQSASTVTTSIELGQKGKKLIVQAIYDYTASESDELTFSQGDIVYDCEYVDSGWMMGTHSRTRKTGMLPANYVLQLI